jgi:hypothetical protein
VFYLYKLCDIWNIQYMIYRGGPISPNLSKSPKKPYSISRFLARILLVPISTNLPISTNFVGIYISNYFLGVMIHDSWMTSFSGLTYPNLVFSTFIWLPLVKYLILDILLIHFIRIYCETPYEIQKLFDIWRHFERLRVF